MKLLVLLNQMDWMPGGREPEAARQEIADAFAAAGADAEVRAVDPKFIVKHAKEALQTDVDAIVAGGSAGTVHRIASMIADGHKAFGVLPLGTENGFARELGIPSELNQAVNALARAKVIELPVMEVNGLLFLSYLAVGQAPGKGAASDAGWMHQMLGRIYGLRLSARGHEVARRSPGVVVSNNVSQVRAFGLHLAPTPEQGLVNIYVAKPPGVVKRLMGRQATRFGTMALPEVRIDAPRRKHVAVSIDGISTTLATPLRVKLRERGMKVLAVE